MANNVGSVDLKFTNLNDEADVFETRIASYLASSLRFVNFKSTKHTGLLMA